MALDLEPNGWFQLSNQGHNYYEVTIEPATRRQLQVFGRSAETNRREGRER